MLTNFDITQDFHSTNPHIRVILPQSLKVPSQHMWGLMLYAHPDSKLFNESPSERKKLVLEYINDNKFTFEKYEDLLELIERKVLTKAQKSLMVWERALHKRDEYIDSIEYTEDSWDMLDKMLANSAKLWAQYQTIVDWLSKESSKTLGDQEESLTEKGLI